MFDFSLLRARKEKISFLAERYGDSRTRRRVVGIKVWLSDESKRERERKKETEAGIKRKIKELSVFTKVRALSQLIVRLA